MAITGGQVGFTGYQQPDYSGVVAASGLPLATLSKSISDFSDYKKEQKKVDADNKASAKAIEAAITLGKSYEVSGVEETLSPFLNAYNDPNLSPIQKAAMLNEGKGMVANVFGRFDASQADAIQRAQIDARNEPPMPTPLTYKRATNVPYGGGFLDDLLIGSDGEYYDEARNLVADMGAFARGESPEVYSGYSTFSDDLGSLNTPLPSLPEDTQNIAPFILPIDTGRVPTPLINAGQINSALEIGSVLPSIPGTFDNDLAASIAALEAELNIDKNKRKEIQSRIRFDADKVKKTYTLTPDQAKETMSQGGSISVVGRDDDGNYIVESETLKLSRDGQTIEFTDPDGKIVRITSGGGVGDKTEKGERAANFQAERQTNFIIDKANEAIEIIDNSISTYGGGTLIDITKSAFPGTQEYKLKNQIFPALKDSIALDAIKQLKAASPTGSTGLGSVTEKEGKRLENMYGVLDIGGDKFTLKNDIKRLKLTAFDYIHGSKDEREKALAEGKITKDQNDQVEQMYREQILGVSVAKAPASSGVELLPDEEELIDKHKTK